MLHRIFISITLALATVGISNCSSESAADLNDRMWTDLERGGWVNKSLFDGHPKPNINAKKNGETSLMYVVRKIREPYVLPLVNILVAVGANVNATNDAETQTALTEAVVYRSNLPIVEFLLDHGARPDLKPRNGNSAIEIAFKLNIKEMVEAMAPYVPRQLLESLIAAKRKEIEELGNLRRDTAIKSLMLGVIYAAHFAMEKMAAAEKKMEAERAGEFPPPPSYEEAMAERGAPPAYEEEMSSIPGGPK